MFDYLVCCLVLSAFSSGAVFLLCRKTWGVQIRALKQEVQQLSEAVCQMAEMQSSTYQKISATLGDLEERFLNLAIPSESADLPLEKKHQVCALSRKGVPVDEIVRRLRMPRGEVELILSLKKYLEIPKPPSRKTSGEHLRHDQA